MADGDIVLRNPGATGGDIALTGVASGSFTAAGDSGAVFTASLVAQVASLQAEVIAEIGLDAEVASLQTEVILELSGDADIASTKVEVLANLAGDADLASLRVEVVPARPVDLYSPFVPPSPPGEGGGLCESFASAVGFEGTEACCDGFASPECGGGGGAGPPSDPVLLAFAKLVDDEVLLCTRTPPTHTGLYPVTAFSVLTWARISDFSGAGVAAIINAQSATLGWRLASGGSADPEDVLVQYRDTGAALLGDTHTFGGSLVDEWHAIGGFRSRALPVVDNPDAYRMRAFVDDELGAVSSGTVAPQSGAREEITLFGTPGALYVTGRLLSPLFTASDLGSGASDDAAQLDYFTDLGKREAGIFTTPALLLAPRAASDVEDGDPVLVWTVDFDDAQVAGPTVYGTPAYWRGPWWGLAFTDIHWIEVPWVDDSLAAGATLILGIQGASAPGADQFVTGRMSAGSGGVEVIVRPTDGTDARCVLYDAAGASVLTLDLAVTETLGSRFYYVVRIGVGGTAQCEFSLFDVAGVSLVTVTGTPSAAVVLNQNQRWGRAHGGSAYTAGECFRWVEYATTVNNNEVEQIINREEAADLDIWGVNGNVVDDGDPVKLWGPHDSTGAYASQIIFESIGGSEIVVGS